MSPVNNEMATAQAQFETWLDESPVLQTMQTGIGELARRMSSLELRMDRDERRGEIAIERISAHRRSKWNRSTLMRVDERGVRLEEQLNPPRTNPAQF